MKSQKNNLVRSPLHYNGNKFSIADAILSEIGEHKEIIEIFGGTGIVSLNSKADKVWINDTNDHLISILEFIKGFTKEDEKLLIELTDKYRLSSDLNSLKSSRINNGTKGYSEINKDGFMRMRENYNSDNSIHELFLLSNYAFNRMLRFNSSGKFNVPVGKGDFSIRQLKYLYDYKEALVKKNTILTRLDYREILPSVTGDQFLYIDPPYLNGNAQYNAGWNREEELELYDRIDQLDKKGIKFALSNTLFLNGIKNDILENWIHKNNYRVIHVDKMYSKTSYNKKSRYDAKELLITNV